MSASTATQPSSLKALVALHDENKRRSGVLELTRTYTRKMFRAHLSAESQAWAQSKNAAGHGAWKNGSYRNSKRPYGDYLFHQDRDMFEDLYRLWLVEIKKAPHEDLN